MYASLAKLSGQVGSGTSVLVRALLVVICLGLIGLLVALRGHKWLQLALVLPTLLITSFYVVMAQIAASGGAPQHTYKIAKAPTSCLAALTDDRRTASASLSESEPEDLGYPTKTVNRIELRDLLIDASFDALDSILTAYSDSAQRDFRLEYRMSDAYDAFSTASPELEPFMDDWVSSHPKSANAYLVRATYYSASAWHARGAALSRNTTFRQSMAAHSYFTQALADLDSALRRAPCSLAAYEGYMDISPFVGDTGMSRESMDQALLVQPYSFLARESHILNLRPRWGGSYDAMEQLAQGADSLANRNPRLRTLHGFVSWDQADYAVRKKDASHALELYQHALSFGDFWRFRLKRGQLYHWVGREEESLADLERALVQRPQHAELLDVLARTKYELGRRADGPEAHRLFYETYGDQSLAVLLDPGDEDYQESMAFYKKAIPEYAH